MIVGRTFSEDHLRAFILDHPLVREAATGLVFRDAAGAAFILAPSGFVDAAGKPATPAAPLSIPHPSDLSDEVIATFQDALAARKNPRQKIAIILPKSGRSGSDRAFHTMEKVWGAYESRSFEGLDEARAWGLENPYGANPT